MSDSQETIMLVDDTPANLKLLQEMLQAQGYRVLAFPGGRMALHAAAKNPPDLILLDINMPEMNGYEVCEQLKADKALKDIPVLFISALSETADKVKAFSAGGVDYVTKPFQFKEVIARVSVHLELRRERNAIKKLLSDTLLGTIKALNELLAIASPGAYRGTLKVTQHVKTMAAAMGIQESWRFEMAAMLSNLGHLVSSRPDGVTPGDPAALGPGQSDFDKKALDEVSRVILCIPRLEPIASILAQIAHPPDLKADWRRWPNDVLGAQVFRVAAGFERRLEKGLPVIAALEDMRQLPMQFHPDLVGYLDNSVLRTTDEGSASSTVMLLKHCATPAELRPGDILAYELTGKSGVTLLSKGTQLTMNLCSLLAKLAAMDSMDFPIQVLRAKA